MLAELTEEMGKRITAKVHDIASNPLTKPMLDGAMKILEYVQPCVKKRLEDKQLMLWASFSVIGELDAEVKRLRIENERLKTGRN